MTAPGFASGAALPDFDAIIGGHAQSKRLLPEEPKSFRIVMAIENCGRYPDGDPELRGKPLNRIEYAVKSIEFDTLTDDFVDIRLPRGTRVLDVI